MKISPTKRDDSVQPPSRDAELIRRYRAGDAAAFDELVAEHIDAVYSFVARYVGVGAAADDVVQDVFIKVWKNISRFEIGRNFRTWLFTIAKNTALDWLKKKKPVAFSELGADDDSGPAFEETLAANEPTAAESFDQKLGQRALEKALSGLPAGYRDVVLLRLDSQLTFREIAETLDKPLNTVKSHYRRALGMLREGLDKRTK